VIPSNRNPRWLTLAGLTLLLILGAYLRLVDLDARSMTHPEMWVPNIRMPEGLSEPRQRLTLWKVLTGTLSTDTHPPFFYVLMWAWTKCFGTSIWSIRLPSALLGIACIPLLFWLASLAGQRTAGWVGAALLAANGPHVFWSKVARMFSLACFLGVLATILLLLLARETRPRPTLQIGYMLVILLGLASHIFFWALFITHMFWTLLNAWGKSQRIAGVSKLQILTLILGSPLVAFGVYQSSSPVAFLSGNVLVYARELVQFSFLFPQEAVSGLFASSPSHSPSQLQAWASAGPLFIFSLFLFFLGIKPMKQPGETLLTGQNGPSGKLWIAAAGLGVLAILTFILMAKRFVARPNPTLQLTKLMIILPVLLAGLGFLIQKTWHRLPNWGRHLVDNGFFMGSPGLVKMSAVVPFVILSAISLFRPILNQRGMLFIAPYVLLVLAAGMVSLLRRRWLAVSLFMLVGVLHGSSLVAYSAMRVDPADFKTFSAMLAPRLEKTDLIFLQPNWSVTPIFYYLTEDRYRFVGRDYREACRQEPEARVWALFFYQQGITEEMAEALADYQVLQRVEIPYARAVLYSRKRPESLSSQ